MRLLAIAVLLVLLLALLCEACPGEFGPGGGAAGGGEHFYCEYTECKAGLAPLPVPDEAIAACGGETHVWMVCQCLEAGCCRHTWTCDGEPIQI